MSIELNTTKNVLSIVDVDINSEKPSGHLQIFFGMGCFWGAERKFWSLKGVFTTAVGYAGGHLENPKYDDVCSGETGHAEVVRVFYNPSNTSLEDLMRIFWESHNPTQLNRQGNDKGTQYRSIILTDNKELLPKLKSSKKKYQEKLNRQSAGIIQTKIELLKKFYLAENYHQKYLHKNPNGYCGLQGTGIDYV